MFAEDISDDFSEDRRYRFYWIVEYFWISSKFGTEKTVTATDVTGFYAFFSARKSGNFMAIALLNYTVNLEKRGKIHWRK